MAFLYAFGADPTAPAPQGAAASTGFFATVADQLHANAVEAIRVATKQKPREPVVVQKSWRDDQTIPVVVASTLAGLMLLWWAARS